MLFKKVAPISNDMRKHTKRMWQIFSVYL